MTGGWQTNHDSKTSSWQAFLHLLKGYVGPGCLSLPWAVTQLGMWLGILACLLLGYWTSYNAWTVVKLKRQLQAERRQRGEESSSSATNSDAEAILTYPDIVGWLYGSQLERCSRICICVQQLAICTVFLSFIGANLHAVLEATLDMTLHHVLVVTAVLPAVLALSLLRNVRALTPAMAVGMIMMLVALALLVVVMAHQWPSNPWHPDLVHLHSFATWPLALCAILYAYEGICLVVPIESSMSDPQQFGRVFWTAMACVALLYAILSTAAVMVFGPVTSGSLTAFLLEQYARDDDSNMKHLLLAINAFVSVSVLFTYPLQLMPALELLELETPLGACCRTQWKSPSRDDEVEYYQGRFVDMDEQPLDSEKSGSFERQGRRREEKRNSTHDGLVRMEYVSRDDSILSRSDDGEEYEPAHEDDTANIRTRTCLVLSTYLVAILVPNIEILISLAGAVAGSFMALFIPPLLQIAAHQRSREESSYTRTEQGMHLSYSLVVIALAFMFIGTAASLTDIIRIYLG